jgi:hypothetical protein
MRTANRLAVVAMTAIAFSLPAAAAAPAEPPTGAGGGFGQHVAGCAQTMRGFTGEHNPGMHHGASGWDGQPCE